MYTPIQRWGSLHPFLEATHSVLGETSCHSLHYSVFWERLVAVGKLGSLGTMGRITCLLYLFQKLLEQVVDILSRCSLQEKILT